VERRINIGISICRMVNQKLLTSIDRIVLLSTDRIPTMINYLTVGTFYEERLRNIAGTVEELGLSALFVVISILANLCNYVYTMLFCHRAA